jgi:hypothetical protein
MRHLRGEAMEAVCLAMGVAVGTAAWGGEGAAANWREARGMSRGQGQDIVRVQTVEEKTVTAQDSGETIRLTYAMPSLKAVKQTAGGEEKSVLALGNAPLAGDAGKPVLPVVPCYVALPAGSEVDSVEVVCGPEVKLAGRHVIVHGQKPVPLVEDAEVEETPPDAAVYGSDEAWPKARHEVVTVQKKRGMSVVVVNLNPVMYRPKSGEVSYFETMELRVKTRPKAAAAVAAGAEPEVRVREDKIRPLSEKVDNPADLESYKPLTK